MTHFEDPKITRLLRFLDHTFLIEFITSEFETAKKLGWLEDADRDFLRVTPELIKTAEKAIQHGFDHLPQEFTDVHLQGILDKMGEKVLEHILKRFRRNTEFPMRPLAPDTIKRKGHSKIGIDSGDMFRDLLNSEVKVVKKL